MGASRYALQAARQRIMELERQCQAGVAQQETSRGKLRAAMEREHAQQVDQLQVGSISCEAATVRSAGRSGWAYQRGPAAAVILACLP